MRISHAIALASLLIAAFFQPACTVPAEPSAEVAHLASTAPASAIPVADEAGPGRLSSAVRMERDFAIAELSVRVDVHHPRLQDLALRLRAPDGRSVELLERGQAVGTELRNTVFRLGHSAIADLAPPYSGNVAPAGDPSALLGRPGLGDWTLEVENHSAEREVVGAELMSWTLVLMGGLSSNNSVSGTVACEETVTVAATVNVTEDELHCYEVRYSDRCPGGDGSRVQVYSIDDDGNETMSDNIHVADFSDFGGVFDVEPGEGIRLVCTGQQSEQQCDYTITAIECDPDFF